MQKSSKPKLILVDSHAVAHRAKHSMKGLSYDEKATGVIFGFLNTVLDLAEKFKTTKFIFAWDTRKNFRKEICSSYKSKIYTKTPEQIELDQIARPQFITLRNEILPRIGFKNIFYVPGYEADDVIASIVKDNQQYQIIVSSKDQDLYQLLDFCHLYKFDNNGVYTKDHFVKEYKIQPSQWVQVKCLAGCNSDNVIGINGVGEKTAIKYIQGVLSHKTKVFDAIESEEGQRLVTNNQKIVSIPMDGVGSFEITQDQFDLKQFISVCNELGFLSIINTRKLTRWNDVFVEGKF